MKFQVFDDPRCEQDTPTVIEKNLPSQGLLNICASGSHGPSRFSAGVRDQQTFCLTYVIKAGVGSVSLATEFAVGRCVGDLLEPDR